MEVSKILPPESPPRRAEAAVTAEKGAVTADQGSPAAADLVSLADSARIGPLNVQGALQILLAEVRAAWDLQLLSPGGGVTAGGGPVQEPLQEPVQAARDLIEMLLRSLPADTGEVPEWSAALLRAEPMLLSSMDRALDTIAAWREVPTAVVDAARQTRAVVVSALNEDVQNPLWLRLEWLGLAPRMQRYWRRRRAARRLTDPDHGTRTHDVDEDLRQ